MRPIKVGKAQYPGLAHPALHDHSIFRESHEGYKGFSEAQFEKPLPTGLRGTDPHLDFF